MFNSLNHSKIRLLILTVFIAFTVAVSVLGYALFRHLREASRADVYTDLTIIGRLKSGQLKNYLKERQSDARTMATLLALSQPEKWLSRTPPDLPETLRAALSSLLVKYDYSAVLVLDRQGVVHFQAGQHDSLSPAALTQVQQVLRSDKPVISPIYFGDTLRAHPVLDFIMPISGGQHGQAAGVLLLRSDLTSLYLTLQAWPVLSESAEALLVTRQDQQVQFLNELRHHANSTLSFALPLAEHAAQSAWPESEAARGKTTLVSGLDYRGESVLGYALPVPGTPWGMLVKMDQQEALEPINNLGKIALLVGGVFWLLAGHLAWLWWRKQSAERDLAAMRLHDSSTRIASILDTVLDGILTIDEHGVIQTVNPSAERLFGYTAAEMIGQNVKMLMPSPYHEAHDGYLQHYRASHIPHIIGKGREVQGRRKDGSVFPIELAVSEMTLGQQTHFTGTVRDMTQRKQVEHLLQQAKERAEQANVAKDAFLATMSHEIRTPLGGMLGMLELLELSALDAAQRDTLHTARDSGENLLRVLNDILDWSKMEADKLRLSLQAVSLPVLLQQVYLTYLPLAQGKNLRFQQDICCDLPQIYWADPLRLGQILHNLVSNAIKFTESGQVRLRVECVQLGEQADVVRFSVQDSGIGIAPDAQVRLFQNYGQASGETARLYGGTGLGLAIAHRLAVLMGGQLTLHSELGQGSLFSLTLTLPHANQIALVPFGGPRTPRNLPQPNLHQAANTLPPLLVVDDHPINRKLLLRQLQVLGLQAEVAENGQIALAKWRSAQFAAIITDCHMPEMDGYQLAQQVRALEQADNRARTPIIAWTANAVATQRNQCLRSGMDDVLLKPSDLPQLHQMLLQWLPLPVENAAAVDFRALQSLSPDLVGQQELLRDFQQQNRLDVADLQAALHQGDHEQIRRQAHRIKGASRMVGATALAQFSAELEAQAAQAQSINHLETLPLLERIVLALDDAIARFCQQ